MTAMRPKFILSLLMIGIIAGGIGILLTLLIHFLQHLTFGVPLHTALPFRLVVEQASAQRRFYTLVLCGLVVGVGWVALHRYGKPLVEIKNAVHQEQQNMPFLTTIAHALLQIITVAMGSPLGREVAPREMSAAFANQWVRLLKLDTTERKVLLACASGAGLAAVYNVPLAAVIFVLETLLLSWNMTLMIAALLCCGTAVFVARLGLGDLIQYPLGLLEYNSELIYFAFFVGPLLAFGVFVFDKNMQALPILPRKKPIMIVVAVIAFALIGLISIWYPEILGNGKAANQLSFALGLSADYAIGLFIAKWLALLLASIAGAYGGRITPSMMLGGLLAFLSAYCWNMLFPAVPITTAAIIGAAVFLGLSFAMPITATLFLLELTRFSPAFLYPICICFITAMLCLNVLHKVSK